MALPKWITPAGNLGVVPELEYYEFPLDAYDASGGSLTYFLVSGTLPLGLQIVGNKIAGVPVSQTGPDLNETYTFTIRIQNLSTGKLSDRTFDLTITNVSPPVISYPTRNEDLGLFLDGTPINIQLTAIDFIQPQPQLQWTLKSGDLPSNLTLSESGLLSGVIQPVESTEPGTTPAWDETAWSYLGWDFPYKAISKKYTFTVEVFDSVNYDQSTYSLTVYPRSSLTTDNDQLNVSTTDLGLGVPLTIDYGNKHNPFIATLQDDFVAVREGSYYAFQIQAYDLDDDIIYYSIPTLDSGSFDEQVFSNVNPSYTYIAASAIDGRLYSGIYPMSTESIDYLDNTSVSTLDYTESELASGDTIKVLVPDPADPTGSAYWKQATVTSNVTVRLTGTTKTTATSGQYLTQTSSTANLTIAYASTTTGKIKLQGTTYTGFINTVLPRYDIILSGNIRANVGDIITQLVSNANARVTANVINSNVINVLYTQGNLALGVGNIVTRTSNIRINSSNVAVYPTTSIKDANNITLQANVGDIITQTGSSGNATVTANVRDAVSIPVSFNNVAFNSLIGNVKIKGADANVVITSLILTSNPFARAAAVGDYIYQPSTGANALITATNVYGNVFAVEFTTNNFTTGSGNIQYLGSNVSAYPSEIIANTDITGTYNNSDTFFIRTGAATYINAVSTGSNITSLVSVGITVSSTNSEGVVGFDNGKFDQGALALPGTLTLNQSSGWIVGQLPGQTINQIDYEFEVLAYKRDDPTYSDTRLYSLTVLGDLNNTISWVTASDLGTIETGKISSLYIEAVSPIGKTLYYELATDSYQRLPQGLRVTSTGLISGRVSFEVFSLDASATEFDTNSAGAATTTFDFSYRFTVTARDLSNTISANKTFTLRLKQFDKIPYEDLYLRASTSAYQRVQFADLMTNRSIFPLEKIYRIEDPWFGLATELRTLFLAGLSPSTLESYTAAAAQNHFRKRLTFGEVKTAQVLGSDFKVKYEVVYLTVQDENTNPDGTGPANSIELAGTINPYYDVDGNAYTTAYPNSFKNMDSVMVEAIGYQDYGALPDWMTSLQANGLQLGFTRGVVLAYTKPGESDNIAYRLRTSGFNFNTIDFTVDRYDLNNVYSANYDIAANAFITSTETTFDRYPALSSGLTNVGTVDYAVSLPFDSINNYTVQGIRDLGGLDGIQDIRDGDTLVFAEQEYRINETTIPDYNQGWANVVVLWDEASITGWAEGSSIDSYDYSGTGTIESDDDVQVSYDSNQAASITYGPGYTATGYDLTPGQQWDQAEYVPGYNEHLLDPSITNKRIGIWKVNILYGDIITLSFVQEVSYYQSIYVRNGFTYGGTNIFFDPLVKPGKIIPNYSKLPQQIKTTYTKFDGGGTRWFNYRDQYIVPEQGDKYIKFTKTGVFT
jgi:hypothetical protein